MSRQRNKAMCVRTAIVSTLYTIPRWAWERRGWNAPFLREGWHCYIGTLAVPRWNCFISGCLTIYEMAQSVVAPDVWILKIRHSRGISHKPDSQPIYQAQANNLFYCCGLEIDCRIVVKSMQWRQRSTGRQKVGLFYNTRDTNRRQ